ncbi:acetylglutamate kinase [Oligella ureolytica]
MTETSITPATIAEIIFESMPYTPRSHGKTILIKFGGNAMLDEQLQKSY